MVVTASCSNRPVRVSKSESVTYTQPAKVEARRLALTHAVDLVTSRRDAAALVSADHPERVRDALLNGNPRYREAAAACRSEDLESWRSFRDTSVGKRTPSDITVAYLAGPEPENDLELLLELGVRPENIWAFEVDKTAAARGLDKLRRFGARGIKFIPAHIEDYFVSTPRRFDIVYIDACGPLANKDSTRILMTMFRHNALAPLGVLVSNFARPDVSKPKLLESYAFLIGAYLYPKSFLESSAGGFDDGAEAYGYVFNLAPEEPDDPAPDFRDAVKADFELYYGTFITRSLIDMASIVAPMARLVDGDLYKVAFKEDLKTAVERGARLVRFNFEAVDADEEEDADPAGTAEAGQTIDPPFIDFDGQAITDKDQHSLLWTLAACGAYEVDTDFDAVPQEVKSLLASWCSAMLGKKQGRTLRELVAIFYAWRRDPELWSDAMQRIAEFSYRGVMPFLCDGPSVELGFYPAFAQLAYPAHANVREAKRFRYVAKQTPMFMDVIAFDECRYVYDWLSALHLTPEDWHDLSAQLTFRFALDAIAAERRWFGEDFLFGCHAIGQSPEFPMSDLAPREDLSRGEPKEAASGEPGPAKSRKR